MTFDMKTHRESLMKLLYQYDLYQSDQMPWIPSFEDESIEPVYQEIIGWIQTIDTHIESSLYDYSLYRLSFVDRAIIRLATYELMKKENPKEVIINEAIELTKTFSNLDDEKQHRFNNKVLDTIAKKLT